MLPFENRMVTEKGRETGVTAGKLCPWKVAVPEGKRHPSKGGFGQEILIQGQTSASSTGEFFRRIF